MHEFSLIHDLLEKIAAVAREHGATKVTGAKVKLGALAHISPEHLQEHFAEAAAGTVAEGAQLEVVLNPDEKDEYAQDILLESVDVEEDIPAADNHADGGSTTSPVTG